jgi:DNA-binding transcriptional ArsR family regulator
MTYQDSQLDAIGDQTRRAILVRLRGGAMPVGELARGFRISRPAISQHLRILKDASLVIDRPAGNRRLYALNPKGFASLRAYFEQFWTAALDAFKEQAESADSTEEGQ